MKHDHRLAPTTQTLELRQLREINARMRQPEQPHVTAKDLGLDGATPRGNPFAFDPKVHAPAGLPVSAVLLRLTAEGPPECPHFTGHFCLPPVSVRAERDPDLAVTMHTDSLHRLSQLLHLHHAWGGGVPVLVRAGRAG